MQINQAILSNQDRAEQRQDIFDPTGKADWGVSEEMGGFFAGQTNI